MRPYPVRIGLLRWGIDRVFVQNPVEIQRNVMLEGNAPKSLEWTPLRVEPTYKARPSARSAVITPPVSGIRPAWNAARHIAESSV